MTVKYEPFYIQKPQVGLVQSRPKFALPEDASTTLENAYVWREKYVRKSGTELLGRLRRVLVAQALGVTDGFGDFSGNIITILSLESDADIQPRSISIVIGAETFTEPSPADGTLIGSLGGTGTINYATGDITISGAAVATAISIDFNYFPNLPCMGIRNRELNSINVEQTVVWDTKYAYRFSSGYDEFIAGTTWTGNNSNFFWTTNYWTGTGNLKIFWATNFSTNDPIRYTNGVQWIDFAPTINASGDQMFKCLAMLPFRSRMLSFNTYEGATLAGSIQFRQRIRWAEIGNPFDIASSIVSDVSVDAWRDDIRGKGGYLDIPTAQNIVAVGFVRDNLVIFCERSTWQLRYTGQSIAPFQIEKVNTELGAESTFSAVQFDTSLVGIGDKGIVECDSFKSERIDIKIPDLVYDFENQNDGLKRVHGIRDFKKRLAYWTYPYAATNPTYPNRRLVYNYENDSWAIFTDSLTALGTYQPTNSRTWADATYPWSQATFPWLYIIAESPVIVGGNQKGYISYLDAKESNDISLNITGITGNTTTPTSIEIIDHNLETGMIIQIEGILGSGYSSLNQEVFLVRVTDDDNFTLLMYDPDTQKFSSPRLDTPATYIGGGSVIVLDNFRIVSKKYNFSDQGQQILLGWVDVLLDKTSSGQIALNIYTDYEDNEPVNTSPENNSQAEGVDSSGNVTIPRGPDMFFNVDCQSTNPTTRDQSVNWQRIYCPVRGNFITLEWTLTNEQMQSISQQSEVQINAQILWIRKAGKILPVGI